MSSPGHARVKGQGCVLRHNDAVQCSLFLVMPVLTVSGAACPHQVVQLHPL